MKEATVHSLVIARTLLEQANPLCRAEDRYIASAGLVILQDALEVVLYALLLELGVDERKNLESKPFDELVAELKAAGVTVPKSGTLKALNKQRVLTKHYAQVAEPVTVRNYYDTASAAIDAMTTAVVGKSVQQLFIADILGDSEAKEYLKAAETALNRRRYLDALSEIRKAIYVEFEESYNVYGWREYDGTYPVSALASMGNGGWNAPSWTKNKKWIGENVKSPTDFIQVDYQHLRLQAMELGIHTVELENLRRMTPEVFRIDRKSNWSIKYAAEFEANNATEENTRYCLDRAISILLKKQLHKSAARRPRNEAPFEPPDVYVGNKIFKHPSETSEVVHVVAEGDLYTIKAVLHDIRGRNRFYEVVAESKSDDPNTKGTSLLSMGKSIHHGYLLKVPELPELPMPQANEDNSAPSEGTGQDDAPPEDAGARTVGNQPAA